MKKLFIVIIGAVVLVLSSCTKKTPDFVNSIPDDAIAVATINPMQLHTKSKIITFESIKEKVKDEAWQQILEDPLSTGLMMNEYVYVFVKMEEQAPVIGVVAGMKDVGKFETTLGKLKQGIQDEFQTSDTYTWIRPDEEGIIAWNDKEAIVLVSPDNDELATPYFTGTLDKMFDPVKEESITSMVDFKDFLGKMKDINLWVSSNDVFDLLKKVTHESIPDIPVALYHNYAQIFVDFADGELDINGETHFSEEVEKNIEEFLVMKPELNQDLLNMAPGGNLLLALAGSIDLEKTKNMIDKFAPPELDSMGNKVEKATGMEMEDLLKAITGDFVVSVNGIEGEAMIPLEVFVGVGVNGKALQEKLMQAVEGMAPLEEEGDFFIMNMQGNEIYIGIVNNVLVITNSKGYKDAIESGSHPTPLKSSRFGDFAGGSMGLYLNLDLSQYPAMVQGLISQKPQRQEWVQHLTEPFDYLGISAGNYKNRMVLKTSTPGENSLYTIMKMIDQGE